MISVTKEVLEDVLEVCDEGDTFFVVENRNNNKTWLLPREDVKCGLQIYQPTSFKGKAMKMFLAHCVKTDALLHLLKIKKGRYALKENVREAIQNTFCVQTDSFQYSVYIGDTKFAENRKAILQISANRKLKGYMKITREEVVKQAFLSEVNALRRLKSQGIRSIPEVLWEGDIGNRYCFIQSTEKEGNEPVVRTLTQQHWNFLDELYSQTSHDIDFIGSDYCKLLDDFYAIMQRSNWQSKQFICDVINLLKMKFSGKKIQAAFIHGDFTPWNICVKPDRVFVFDFEYSKQDFPAGFDAFHFITQVGALSFRQTGDEIFQTFKKQEKEHAMRIENPTLYYLCYLLYIMSFYYRRYGESFSENERVCVVWMEIIQQCLHDLIERGERLPCE